MTVKMPTVEAERRPTPIPQGGITSYRGPSGDESAPGEALMRAGSAAMGAGNEQYAAFKVEEEKTNTLRAEEAFSKLRERQLQLTYGKEEGFENLRGSAAIDRPLAQEWGGKFNEAYRQIESGLGNDEQKAKFKQRATLSRLQFDEGILKHLASENNTHAKQVTDGAIKTELANVAANPTSNMAMAFSLERVNALVDKEVERQGFRGKEATEQADIIKRNVKDQMWNARIDAVLYSMPVLADKLFRENEKEISSPQLKLVLQAKTREAATSVSASIEAQKVVDEVRQIAPPASAPTIEVGSGPRSLRNNNPGNIEKSAVKWAGEVPGSDSRFVTFATPEDGFRAMQQNLLAYQDKHGLKTVESIIGRWAPAKENGEASTRNYVKAVSAALGVKPGEEINLRDPTMMQAMVTAMAQVEAGGSSEPRAGAGGMRKVSSQDPQALNTTGMPTSRDVAAQLPFMMLRVERRANELYGPDQGNPDRSAFIKRMQTEIQSRVAADVQQINAIQRQAQGILIDAIAGQGAPGAGGMVKVGGKPTMVTAFSQIQSDPELMRQWQLLDPGVKPAMLNLIQKNMEVGKPGDEPLYRELWNRIHLEPGDPKKIEFYKQITDPAVADRLSIPQIRELRLELDRAETPGGRSVNQMRKNADSQVALFFKTNMMFTAQPDRQIGATNRWNEEVGRKVDEYVKAGAFDKVRAMFMVDTPESVVPGGKAGNAYLQTFINSTPAQGVAAGAAAVREGAPPMAAQAPAVQPSTIKTRAELDAWFQTLPEGVKTFTGTDGQVRMVPARAPTAAAAVLAPAAETKPAAAMNEAGKLVAPAPAPKAKDPDALPTFRAQRGLSPEEQEQHLGGLWAAAKAVAGSLVQNPLEVGVIGSARDLVNAVVQHSSEFRETETRAMFQHLLKRGEFTPLDVPVVRAAVKYGNLDPGELKKAKAMLKAAGVK